MRKKHSAANNGYNNFCSSKLVNSTKKEVINPTLAISALLLQCSFYIEPSKQFDCLYKTTIIMTKIFSHLYCHWVFCLRSVIPMLKYGDVFNTKGMYQMSVKIAAKYTHIKKWNFPALWTICLHRGYLGVMNMYRLKSWGLTAWSRCALVITEIIQSFRQLYFF